MQHMQQRNTWKGLHKTCRETPTSSNCKNSKVYRVWQNVFFRRRYEKTQKFPQNLRITSTSLNTSFPHLTLILKAGMLSATEAGLWVRYKSQILGSQQKQISLGGTEPYPLSRYEFPPRCQVIPVLKAATCLLWFSQSLFDPVQLARLQIFSSIWSGRLPLELPAIFGIWVSGRQASWDRAHSLPLRK